ncbi:MAG: PIN domain-containing protein [Thermodesulfovibrionia bacterium]|nr:PIN domain-containing protein [Thermodesulfovibrionia bacterium]
MKRPARSLPDTNTIVRYLIKDDAALYAKAKDFFDKVKNGSEKAVILESIVAECIYVLTKIYKVPKEMAAGRLIDILRYKGIANSDQKELIHALTLYSEQNLDIVDCILCVKASGSGGHLFSFDEKLNKIARRA